MWWLVPDADGPFDPAKAGYLSWLFSGELPHDAMATLFRVIVGFGIGRGLALPLGLAMGASDRVLPALNPLVQVLRPIPPIAFIPLAILWFGLGNPPAFFLIALGAFFPVLMNTIAGVRHVDAIYIRAARNLGARQVDHVHRVILPAATPYILTGVAHRHRARFIVRDRGGDDRGQQRPRFPHPGGARVFLVGQDHRRDDHHRSAGAWPSTPA